MISLGYVSPGHGPDGFMLSLLELQRVEPRLTKIHGIVSGPRISEARNDLIREFLKTKNEWLLMLDRDMIFDGDIVEKFMQASNPKIRPVVGGLCFGGGRVGVPFPTLYTLVDPATNNGKLTRVVSDYPKDALCKVDATGAAALFCHRQLLIEVGEKYKDMPDGYPNPHPWFAESVQNGHSYGEDWTFCMRLKLMGIPLYVHTGIKLGHVKTQDYNESYYNQWRQIHG